LVDRVRDLAADLHCTPAQLALAWVLAQGDDIVPIPGTKRRAFLDENIGALEVHLSASEIATLERVFAPNAAAGERYPALGMGTIDR
jgi:aryl-alcohol dehydrogenase-like predicted oxidoreductase